MTNTPEGILNAGDFVLPSDRPLVYIYGYDLPGPAANSIQVVAMCEALGRVFPSVYLAAYRRSERSTNIFEHYGADPTFELVWLPGRFRAFTTTFSALATLIYRFGWNWSCYTRIPTVALVCAMLRIPTILEIHGLPIHKRQVLALRLLPRSASLRRVVSISESLSANLRVMMAGAETRVVTAPDGMRLARSEVNREGYRKKLGLPIDLPIVGYAGSLKPDKGVTVLLEAMSAEKSVVTAIAGSHPVNAFEELRKDYESETVRFLGFLPPHQVPSFLASCDVLVAPYVAAEHMQFKIAGRMKSAYIHEFMSPLKIFEYMASGVPFVASDLPVLREVLTHGVNALLFQPGDARELRQHVMKLLNDAQLANVLSAQGLRDAPGYSWDQRVETALT